MGSHRTGRRLLPCSSSLPVTLRFYSILNFRPSEGEDWIKSREGRPQAHCQGQTKDRGDVTAPPTISSPPAQRKGTQNKPYPVSLEMEKVFSSFRYC